MGVRIKPRDIEAQWRRYEAAQSAALRAAGEFARACNTRRPDAECQKALGLMRDAERALQREWAAYAKIAPAKMRTRKKAA